MADTSVLRFKTHALLICRVDDEVGYCFAALDGQYGLGAVGAGYAVFVVDALVKKEDFDILGAIGKQLNVDFCIASSTSVKY